MKKTTKKSATKKSTTKKSATKKPTTKKSATKKPKIPRRKIGKPGKRSKKPKRFKQLLGLSEAHDRIKTRLEETRDRLEAIGLDSRVITHGYRHEVDGEIAITVPRGTTSIEVSAQLEQAFQTAPLGLGRGFWYSLGAIISIHKIEEEERSGSSRIRGKDELEMYYRRVSTPNMIDSYLRQQKVMLPGIEDKYNRKVETVYIRLHWNQENEQPKR